MYLLLTDETNLQPKQDEVRFFIYGGIFFPADKLHQLSALVLRARSKAGYRSTDEFKWETRSRPEYVSVEQHREAKNQVVEGCLGLGVRFIAYLVLHELAATNDQNTLIEWGANSVVGAFHRFLSLENEHGIVLLDRPPIGPAYQYIREKFQVGLTQTGTWTRPMSDRIGLFGFSCSGASHVGSAVDIILGAFRYCVNERRKLDPASAIFRNVVNMMWHRVEGGTIRLRGFGLLVRPKKVESVVYQVEYDELIEHMTNLLRATESAAAPEQQPEGPQA